MDNWTEHIDIDKLYEKLESKQSEMVYNKDRFTKEEIEELKVEIEYMQSYANKLQELVGGINCIVKWWEEQ